MKRTLALLMASALMLSLAGCSQTGGSSSSGEAETLRIGIIQPMEHESLDAAREGFVQALADHGYTDGDTIVLDYQNAQGDSSALLTISQRFVGDDCDLVLAIGTGAAQSIASQTSEIPVLITAVTDPVDAGLVQSSEAPGTNVTGTNDMNPIREQLELIPADLCRCADRRPALHQQRGQFDPSDRGGKGHSGGDESGLCGADCHRQQRCAAGCAVHCDPM